MKSITGIDQLGFQRYALFQRQAVWTTYTTLQIAAPYTFTWKPKHPQYQCVHSYAVIETQHLPKQGREEHTGNNKVTNHNTHIITKSHVSDQPTGGKKKKKTETRILKTKKMGGKHAYIYIYTLPHTYLWRIHTNSRSIFQITQEKATSTVITKTIF